MQKSVKIYIFTLFAIGLLIATLPMITPEMKYEKVHYSRPESFEAFYQKKLEFSQQAGVRPDNQEKLLRFSEKPTEMAFLYIHGFGATRAEGEVVMDRIARRFQANTYYLRLPGHGTNMEDHATRSYTDYMASAEETLQMMPLLGKRVYVFGTSTGALLGTWLAAEYPEMISGLVLVSPFYAFGNPLGNTASFPGGTHLMSLVMGPIRLAGGFKQDSTGMLLPTYDDHWYTSQYYNALRPLALLRQKIARPGIFRQVKTPSLMIYYYKDEINQDHTARVPDMLKGFSQFGGSSASPLNRSVRIEYGTHVLMSEHVKSDKGTIEREIISFVEDVQREKGDD